MTKDSWLICNDPEMMLDFLEGKSSSRKLRLFACACCRRIWPLLTDERSRTAVETAERYADGVASESERAAAERDASDATDEQTRRSIDAGTGPDGPAASAAAAAMNTTDSKFTANDPEGSAPFFAASNALLAVADDSPASGSAEGAAQCHLLRDIFGNPFRPPPPLDPAWLPANVRHLAEAAYTERSLPDGTLNAGRLAVLADALVESGCRDQAILGHFRDQERVHVRGCHVLDLLLGKE